MKINYLVIFTPLAITAITAFLMVITKNIHFFVASTLTIAAALILVAAIPLMFSKKLFGLGSSLMFFVAGMTFLLFAIIMSNQSHIFLQDIVILLCLLGSLVSFSGWILFIIKKPEKIQKI